MKFRSNTYILCLLFLSFTSLHSLAAAGREASLRIVDSLLVQHLETGDGELQNSAFIKLERYRNDRIQAELLACMPDSASRQVMNITNRYAELHYKMAQMQARLSGNVPIDSLDAYQQEIDTYRQTINRRYPHFSYFLSSRDSVSLNKVQQTLVAEKQVIVEYAVTERHVFAIVINRDSVHSVLLSSEPETLLSQVRELTSALHKTIDPDKQSFNIKLAYSLYEKLIAPLEPHFRNAQSLILLPGLRLWGLPFECLVTALPTDEKKPGAILYGEYRDVDFLIRRYAIAYNYSIIGLSTQLGDVYPRAGRGRKLLTMGLPAEINLNDAWLNRYFHENASYIQEEIRQVSYRMWRHEIVTKKDATREVLLRRGREFRWIHLALPVVIDIQTPSNSYLAFAQNSQQTPHQLSISEAMSSFLPADQVILSRSSVDASDDSTGLGVDLLPQSLLLSGVRSVLWSRWLTTGPATSRIMSKFYWELKYKRQTNMRALQHAKLRSLNDSFVFDGVEISSAHPYFWASYMLIGNLNIRPPTFSIIPPYFIVIIAYIIVLSISLIIVRKTVDRSTK